MKVKCIALCDSEGKPVEFSPWLTLGRVYPVLGILMDSNGKRKFQIVTNDRGPSIESLGYYPDSCFEIVSKYRPTCWRDRVIKGASESSPAAWQVEGFLEALYEGDQKANEVFERERESILAEDP